MRSQIFTSPSTIIFQSIRHKATVRKKKKGSSEFQEKDADRRLRLKRKFLKEQDKKRQKIEKLKAAQLAVFKLPPHSPRPDAIPFGTAMRLLRAWGIKSEIFVRSTSSRWSGETKVVAAVRVVPNDHHPKGIKGKVKFPFPVVLGEGTKKKKVKKERIVVILEGEEGVEEARKAGMIVAGKDYLDKVKYPLVILELTLLKIVKLVEKNETLPFDVLLATPKSATLFRQHGRVLGPKGLMPNEKRGTIVQNFESYGPPREEKGIEIKLDADGKTKKGAVLRVVVGKVKPLPPAFAPTVHVLGLS